MKKFVLLVLAFAAVSATAVAEDAPRIKGYVSNSFSDNWELGFAVGLNYSFNTATPFNKSIAGSAYVGATKWLHPVFGARFGIEAGRFSYYGYPTKAANAPERLRAGYIMPRLDLLVNVSNWIGGYKERLYTAVVYAGAGINCTGLTDNSCWNKAKGTFAAGLQNRFRVAKAFNVDLNLGWAITPGLIRVNRVGGGRHNQLTVMVGGTYRFGRRDWDRAVMSEADAKAALDRLAKAEAAAEAAKAAAEAAKADAAKAQKQAAAAQGDAEAAKAEAARMKQAKDDAEKALAEAKANKEDNTKAIETAVAENSCVYFAHARATLTPESKATLNKVAAKIKANSSRSYKIEGFADTKGIYALNVKLADKRASVVYDYLVAQGVDAKRLSCQGCGTDKCQFDADHNRVVVIF